MTVPVSEDNKSIIVSETPEKLGIKYEFQTEHGYLDASYDLSTNHFGIKMVHVESSHQRQGIGKELLQAALQQARQTDARYIVGLVISRECLDAMQAVFGEEALIVKSLGFYEADYPEVRPDSGKIMPMTHADLFFDIRHSAKSSELQP
jgi:GNAT superfamily N-acetyltransferase